MTDLTDEPFDLLLDDEWDVEPAMTENPRSGGDPGSDAGPPAAAVPRVDET